MKVYFWHSPNERIIQSRRGKNIYRTQEIPAGIDVCEYKPLANSVLELVDSGHVVGVAEVGTVPPAKVSMTTTIGLEAVHNESVKEAKEKADVEPKTPKPTPNKAVNESEKKTGNKMQPVGNAGLDDAPTVSGATKVQVPPVVKGNDGLEGSGESGSKSGSDGVHSSNDGLDVLQDRHGKEIDPVPPSDENPRRDRF